MSADLSPARPRIGLIVPPAHGQVPPDAAPLYGERYHFIARGLGIGGISPRGFAQVMDTIVERARELKADGAQAISLMGTSISFYRGAAFTDQLREAMEQATGLPCTTMSHAIVSALNTLGVSRVAVATAYIDELNQHLVKHLQHHGIEVTAIEGLGIEAVSSVSEVPTAKLVELSQRVFERAPGAQAVFMSCGGLLTLDAIAALESQLGVPAIASSPSGFWDLVRRGGWDPRSSAGGRLFTHA